MKINQFVDDADEKFELAQSEHFEDLAKQAQLQSKFSQLRSDYNNFFNKLFFNGKEFTLHRLDWRDLNNGNYLKESLIVISGYPWYVFREIAIIWTVFSFLSAYSD